MQPQSPCQLLVVDDEAEVLKSVRRLFRKKYDIHTAKSAEQGFEILAQHPVQVVLCDQRMPGTSGTEFLARVRMQYPRTVRLILTGYSDIHAVISAINDAHIFRYMTKPWNPEALEKAIDEAHHFHLKMGKKERFFETMKEMGDDMEVRISEKTESLLEANQALKRLYEEKDSLIRQLTEAKETAETANRTKDRFLTRMSHELRTPLNGIMGHAQLLRADPAIAGNHFESLETIYQCGSHLLGMIEEILGFSGNLQPLTIDHGPRPPEKWHQTEKKGKAVGYTGPPRKVLIIDDIPFNRHLLRLMLSNLKFEIEEAGDGGEGMQKMENDLHDLVLLDLLMPVMDGYAFAETCRKRFGKEGPVIIAVTADATPGARQRCLAAGCNDCITKPVQLPELLERIEAHLGVERICSEESSSVTTSS